MTDSWDRLGDFDTEMIYVRGNKPLTTFQREADVFRVEIEEAPAQAAGEGE